MIDIPEHIIEAVRELDKRGKPVTEIAFMTRLTEQTVREILAVITTNATPTESGAAAHSSGGKAPK